MKLPTLHQLKKEAKELQVRQSISYNEALHLRAKEYNFENYHTIKAFIEKEYIKDSNPKFSIVKQNFLINEKKIKLLIKEIRTSWEKAHSIWLDGDENDNFDDAAYTKCVDHCKKNAVRIVNLLTDDEEDYYTFVDLNYTYRTESSWAVDLYEVYNAGFVNSYDGGAGAYAAFIIPDNMERSSIEYILEEISNEHYIDTFYEYAPEEMLPPPFEIKQEYDECEIRLP